MGRGRKGMGLCDMVREDRERERREVGCHIVNVGGGGKDKGEEGKRTRVGRCHRVEEVMPRCGERARGGMPRLRW